MSFFKNYGGWLFVVLVTGCATPPSAPVVVDEDVMLYLGPAIKPEILLFPDYLFMDGLELDQHGRIPGTDLVGADLKSKFSLAILYNRFNALLTSEGWGMTAIEQDDVSFRITAMLKGDTLEVRAVQGSGPTQLFMLYDPGIQSEAGIPVVN